jgi:hypothetical protein
MESVTPEAITVSQTLKQKIREIKQRQNLSGNGSTNKAYAAKKIIDSEADMVKQPPLSPKVIKRRNKNTANTSPVPCMKA